MRRLKRDRTTPLRTRIWHSMLRRLTRANIESILSQTYLPCLLTQQVLIFKSVSSSDIQPSYPLRLQSTLPNVLQVTIWDSWGVVFKLYGGMERPWLRRLGFGPRFEWESQTVPCLTLPISLLLLIDYIQWREPCWESWISPSLWHGHYTRWTTVEMISPKEDIPTRETYVILFSSCCWDTGWKRMDRNTRPFLAFQLFF